MRLRAPLLATVAASTAALLVFGACDGGGAPSARGAASVADGDVQDGSRDDAADLLDGGARDGTTVNCSSFRRSAAVTRVDPSFGDGGVIRIEGSMAPCGADSSGRLVLGGSSGIVRLLTNGDVDTSFGPIAMTDVSSCALDSKGRVLAASGGTLFRFDPDGHADADFAVDGVSLGGSAGLVVPAKDDRVYLVGAADDGGLAVAVVDSDAAVASPSTDIGPVRDAYLRPLDAVVLPDDALLVVAGMHDNAAMDAPTTSFVGKIGRDGEMDRSFGEDGGWVSRTTSDPVSGYTSLVAYCDGTIDVIGLETTVPIVTTLDATGRSVPSRGGSVGPPLDSAYSLPAAVVDGDGFLMLAGNTFLGRVVDDTEPDPTFGSGGALALPTGLAWTGSVAIDRMGRIVVTRSYPPPTSVTDVTRLVP